MAEKTVGDLRGALERAVNAYAAHRDHGDETRADYDASLWHQADGVAYAARDLVRAIEQMPAGERPVGWDEHSHGPFSADAGGRPDCPAGFDCAKAAR
jgi:hypothetical protein